MATQNTGYQRGTNLTVRQGNDARVYSLLSAFVADVPYDNIKYGFLYNWWATQEQGSSYYPANANVWDETNNTATVNILGENEIPFNVYSGEIELTLNEMAESYAELGEYEYMIYTQDGVYHFITVKTSEGEIVNTKPNGYITLNRLAGHSIIADAMASEGWGVPTDSEWTALTDYITSILGTLTATGVGSALKETGTEYWSTPNTGATNELGFNARGGGYRYYIGAFYNIGNDGYWWSATEDDTINAWYWSMYYHNSNVYRYNNNKGLGFSVRLTRPATAPEQLLPDGELTGVYYTGNDGKIYRVTKIGTQVWLADNLAETKWSDGSWIQGYDGGTYTPITDANWAALTTAALCAYGDDVSNVLGTGTAKTTYPALTATELALLSISEFNARVTAFLQYVSEQESMEISDVITNSERVQNETACPIPVGEVFFDGIVDGSVAKDAVMGQTGLDGESLNITITYTISAWAGTIGKQEAITSTTRLFVSTNGGSTYNEIDSVQASIPGEAFDEFDTNDKTSTYLFENVTDPSQIHIYGAYSYGVNLEDTGGRLNVKITNVVPDSGNAFVVCPDTFIQEDGVTPNEGEIGCNL